MRIEPGVAPPERIETPLLVVPWYEGEPLPPELEELDRAFGGSPARAIDEGDFRGKKDEALMLYATAGEGPRRLLLSGLGKRDAISADRLRAAAGRAAARARDLRLSELDIRLPAGDLPAGLDVGGTVRALVEGLVLGSWHFDELRTEFEGGRPPELERAGLWVSERAKADAEAGIRVGRTVAEAQNYARDLVAGPPNVVTPSYLAERARGLGDELGLRVTVLGRRELEEQGLRCVLAVAQGSEQEPQLIILEYRPDGDGEPVALVGKGVTFDSGGLSLKTAEGMESMKYDMSGAAAVIGAIRAIGELDLPVPAVALVPAVENLPSGRSFRPGDIVRSYSGKTVEILNTDAEGRLILADALSYAARNYRPQAMVDLATLTGACVVALGHHAIGLMGTDETLLQEIRSAAERAGERVWALPLWEEYREALRSEIADIKNTGGRPAGTITAAMFLREFAGSGPWAHLDIAGTAWADRSGPYQPKGATGVGVRLLTEWVRSRAG